MKNALIIALALTAGPFASAQEVRTFTSSDGRTIEALVISKTDSSVTLKRSQDGEEFTIPLNRISAADQAFVKRWTAIDSKKDLTTDPDQKEVVKRALDDARKFTESGEYAKALERFEWFHENALSMAPSMAGVRLSFALSDWASLGSEYPPALVSLEAVRDKGAKALLSGDGSVQIFKDVRAIDTKISNSGATIELYRKIGTSQPELARKCLNDTQFVDQLISANEDDLFARNVGDMTIYLEERIKSHIVLCEAIKKGTSADATVVFDSKLRTLTDFMANIARKNGNTDLANELDSMTDNAIPAPPETKGEQGGGGQAATRAESK